MDLTAALQEGGVTELVYMDTSAWTALLKRQAGRSLRQVEGPEYLFSDCNLDQFAAASSYYVAKDLAKLAWRLSNQKRLADHVEFMINEIAAFQKGRPTPSIYAEHPGFHPVWRVLRTTGTPREMKALADETIRKAKKDFRAHLRADRATFRTFFQRLEEFGFTKPWKEMLGELEREGYVGRHLSNLVCAEDRNRVVPDRTTVSQIPYRQLPATAAGTQYFLALRFRAAYESGKDARPDYDDQTDFRHAYYAGIADVFVTEDSKMGDMLKNYVVTKRAEILNLSAFLRRIGAAP